MKIIDAHLHLGNRPWFDEGATACGDRNDPAYVEKMLDRNGVVMAVAMGSGDPDPADCLPDLGGLSLLDGSFFPGVAGCIGINPDYLQREGPRAVQAYGALAACRRVVGFKLYPGYQPHYVSDRMFHPIYDLAQQLDLPVVIHTGDTANNEGLLKYAHPLTVDEAAVAFPATRFVMAHCGNPWIVDAIEVARKNPNVSIDLSGLAVGRFELDHFLREYQGFAEYLAMWLRCLGNFDRLLYGSDWPLVSMEDYIALIAHVVPPRHHDAVFYHNALRVFSRLSDPINQLRTQNSN